ncbi:MAG: type IV toxin-antitoxin system AbiEi family antitoxin domain-containing protein [Gemmatimonadaceae bacterium]
MIKRSYNDVLYQIAESQLGYFTAAQAKAAGLVPVRIIQMIGSGDIERTSRGVYHLTRFPVSRWSQYMEAALWPQVRRGGVTGTISHESALAFYGMSEVSPATVHITLPPTMRIRRTVPRYLTIHRAELKPSEVAVMEGVPVTTPARAIRDAAAAHVGSAIVRQAILDGRRTGHLTAAQTDRLAHELIGESFPPLRILDDERGA